MKRMGRDRQPKIMLYGDAGGVTEKAVGAIGGSGFGKGWRPCQEKVVNRASQSSRRALTVWE